MAEQARPPRPIKQEISMKVDQSVDRVAALVRETVPSVKMDGYVWYDITDQGLEAEVKILRLSGTIAHHPLIHALIRFSA